MALKPTIYKFRLSISDTNRDLYNSTQLTIALHPSENTERMMARVLAYCIRYQPELSFTKGLSSTEEPDLWLKTLDGSTSVWIEVGEPSLDRIKKATRLAQRVDIFSFTSKSDVWWEQTKNKSYQYDAHIFRLSNEGIQALSSVIERGMDLSVMISGTSIFIDCVSGSFEVQIETLQSND